MASSIPTSINSHTPYEDMILYDNGRFANFSKEQYQGICKRFQKFDADDSQNLDLYEVQLMMESLGETKTHAELKAMIAEVDTSKDGTISFVEFLAMVQGPKGSQEESAMTKIYNLPKNQMFEQIAASQSQDLGKQKEQVKKEYEERKRQATLKKELEDAERKMKEEEEQAKNDSKARMAERLKQFQK